jgi:predicted DNA-binding WGR domain protein
MDKWTQRRWEKDTRYYEARVHQDLWGNWVVTRIWGRIGSKLGQIRHTPCPSYEDAQKELNAIEKRRQSRHYRPIEKLLY